MRLYDLSIIILLLAGANLLDWAISKAKPAAAPQCLVAGKLPDGSKVQRWRTCRPDEINATT